MKRPHTFVDIISSFLSVLALSFSLFCFILRLIPWLRPSPPVDLVVFFVPCKYSFPDPHLLNHSIDHLVGFGGLLFLRCSMIFFSLPPPPTKHSILFSFSFPDFPLSVPIRNRNFCRRNHYQGFSFLLSLDHFTISLFFFHPTLV